MSVFKRFRRQLKLNFKKIVFSFTDAGSKNNVIVDNKKTILIIKNDQIGDYVLFRNFLPYLLQSEKYRGYNIVLIGNIAWKSIAEELDKEFFQEMIWVSFDKLFTNLVYRSKIMNKLLANRYEVLFYPVYSGHKDLESFFIPKINAQYKITYSEQSYKEPVFDTVLTSDKNFMFEIDRYNEMFEKFLQISIPDFKWRTLIPAGHNFSFQEKTPYIVLFPDSRIRKKRWHHDNFSLVANALLHKFNTYIIIAGGQKAKAGALSIIKKVPGKYADRVKDLTGKTNFFELANLIYHAQLLITNDSVSIHIAASRNVSSICVFMGENYGRFNPYPKRLYDKGYFICPPDVESKVKAANKDEVFLSLDYYPDINNISPVSVISAATLILKNNKELVSE